MDRELKIWGERWILRKDSTHEVSYLQVRKGYRCSWHRHQSKYNLFVILKGTLKVEVEELGERRTIVLNKGESFTTKPGQWHEFSAPFEDAYVIEEMYVEYDNSDIERKELGGKL